MTHLTHDKDREKTFSELSVAQVDQVGGGVMVPMPINPVVNWIIRQLIY